MNVKISIFEIPNVYDYFDIVDGEKVYWVDDIQKFIDNGILELLSTQKIVDNHIANKEYDELSDEDKLAYDIKYSTRRKQYEFRHKALKLKADLKLTAFDEVLQKLAFWCDKSEYIIYYIDIVEYRQYGVACTDFISESDYNNLLLPYIQQGLITLEIFDGDEITAVLPNGENKYLRNKPIE